jgi:hypothetical protein
MISKFKNSIILSGVFVSILSPFLIASCSGEGGGDGGPIIYSLGQTSGSGYELLPKNSNIVLKAGSTLSINHNGFSSPELANQE